MNFFSHRDCPRHNSPDGNAHYYLVIGQTNDNNTNAIDLSIDVRFGNPSLFENGCYGPLPDIGREGEGPARWRTVYFSQLYTRAISIAM
jgi:hypothetical protein